MTPQEMDIVDRLGQLVEELRSLREVVAKVMVQSQDSLASQIRAATFAQERVQAPKQPQGYPTMEALTPQAARAKMGLKGMAQELSNRSEEKFKKFWQGLADKSEYDLGSNQSLEEKITKSWYRVVTMG